MSLIKKNLVQVDPATGEVQEGLTVLVPVRKRLKDDFSMLTTEGLIKLAVEADLKGEDWKVLAVYLGSMDFENIIEISQKDVAEILGMSKQHVYRSTKKLLEKAILFEDSKKGRSKVYRLSTLYGWKGRITKTYSDLYENDAKLTTEIWMKKTVLKT